MPANPSFEMLQKLFKQQQMAPNTGPIQYGPQEDYANKSIMPSWMRNAMGTGLEGAVDMTQGMLGMGNNSKMNLVGQMIPAAAGVLGMAGKSGMFGKAISSNPMTSQGTISSLAQKKPTIQGAPIMDTSGRFLGYDTPVDEAYAAHVASSRNKNVLSKSSVKVLAPSDEKIDRMLKQYKFGTKVAK